MNYEKIYNALIEYAKSTTAKERIASRDINDYRLEQTYIYTERHHIVPIHDGGDDSNDNLVVLLPEEHLLAHQLRWKAYQNRNDMLAVRFCLNGYSSKPKIKDEISKRTILQGYAWLRQNSANFRKVHGWHTEDGLRRISEARKGSICVKDSVTGESIGYVSVDDPRVISGEYVHHSTGFVTVIDNDTNEKVRITSYEYQQNKSKYSWINDNSGSNNANYKELNEERLRRLYNIIPKCIEENHLIQSRLEVELKREFTEFKRISLRWVKNNFESIQSLLDEYNTIHDTEYKFNPYFRSVAQRQHLSRLNREKNKHVKN